MKRQLPLLLAIVVAAIGITFLTAQDKASAPPLKVLLVAGGCCHDYAAQHKLLYEGIQARANVRVDVWWTDDKTVDPPLTIYDSDDWAAGYDLVIHDECAAGNKDLAVMDRILKAHETIPAVHLHCAMHSFRNGTDKWFKHLGIQSSRHGPQKPIAVAYVDPEHPITNGLEDWSTDNEELYNNVDVFDAHPLAMGTQKYERDGKEVTDVAIVAWTNEAQGARSFSTTLGHNNYTVEDDRYLDLVVRGVLWATDKLNDQYYGVPYQGENEITFVKGKPKPEKKSPPKKASIGKAPKDATLVQVTAQSVQPSNETWHAVDGDPATRWCASNGSKPQWIQMALESARDITGISITWERDFNAYQFLVEGSSDGTSWKTLADETANEKKGNTETAIEGKGLRYLRITTRNVIGGGWVSIREIALKGPGIKSLWPKLDEKQAAAKAKAEERANDPYAKEGNVAPKIVKLSPEEEAEVLKDVTVPDGFDVTLFSNSAAANYPVYVTAAPNGDLYVSSDGNGSLGRDPHRGRVLRLRDKDGDGRADEVTEFVKDVDSPRGAVWDHDRLILLHPPHITAYIDRDGDGVAEESQRLIDNIAFGFADRPADHTTNALEMGIDGWIYIAGGDFGFLEATGSDGRKLQHRNGGVLRFRPDGSGLEVFSTGTRNILGTPTSPLLDLFARDNTNDGGGWDVRFHHFSGLEDHGYPRLYKNFPEEHVKPLADYGGGSGCGSVYLHEPGFPEEWNKAPFTCDWGTGALWKHTVQRVGASFEEITDPQPFIRMTRPTDADIDGMSAVYQASWKGATFRWEGPDVGYIVRVTPRGYQPDPLPDFEAMSDSDLVAALESPSHIRTLAAQRTILRRDPTEKLTASLLALVEDAEKPLEARVAGLYALTQRGIVPEHGEAVLQQIARFNKDPELQPFAMRAMGDLAIQNFPTGLLNYGMASEIAMSNARSRAESAIAAARLGARGAGPTLGDLLRDEDPRVRHVAFQSLARLGEYETCLELLGSEDHGTHAAFALMRMHRQEVVDALISVLETGDNSLERRNALSALCRLYHVEGEWKGDSWGTRPDTRGPYYQPETWEQSGKILAALRSALDQASPDEATFLVREMSRNRIQSNDALMRVLTLSESNPEMVPEALKQLASAGEIPPEGRALLEKSLADTSLPHEALANSVIGIVKSDSSELAPLCLGALATLQANLADFRAKVEEAKKLSDPHKAKSEGKYARQALGDATKQLETARNAFLGNPKLENHHLLIEALSAKDLDSPETYWANAALLTLASRKSGSPESIEMTRKTVESGWKNPKQRTLLIRAATELKNRTLDDRIRIALNDPDPAVAKEAKAAAKALKIQAAGTDKTPKLATLAPQAALEQIISHRGDAALGEAVFARATCSACHTVSQEEAQKGPYLGNIAETYKRPELAVAILEPNKTIAQGFKTNVFTLKDGGTAMGFVTDEQGEQVTIRDIAAQEHTYPKSEIAKREELPTSMMPPGLMMNFTVHEAASLLDYLEELAKK